DRAGPRWRRPVAGSDRLPSGSQRPGDRCGARRTWCGRTWGPPSWSSHHDYGRFPSNFKGKIAQDVAPCAASEYSCRSIAKGLTARIAGLLSKTCQEMGCGCGMTCWRRLRDWNQAGVWQRLHETLLAELHEAE